MDYSQLILSQGIFGLIHRGKISIIKVFKAALLRFSNVVVHTRDYLWTKGVCVSYETLSHGERKNERFERSGEKSVNCSGFDL
jgi:hypothetical protein